MKKSIVFALTLSMAITVAFATGVQDTNGNAKNVIFNGELQQGKYVIGLSNSYFGNTWRKQMVETFSNAAEEAKKADYISNYQIQNGDGTVNAQIAQINRRGRRDYRLPGPGCTLLARCISRFPESQILWIRSHVRSRPPVSPVPSCGTPLPALPPAPGSGPAFRNCRLKRISAKRK